MNCFIMSRTVECFRFCNVDWMVLVTIFLVLFDLKSNYNRACNGVWNLTDWSNDIKWRSVSTLVQVMFYCLTASSHCLKPFRSIIVCTCGILWPAVSWKVFRISLSKISSKITFLKSLPRLPVTNELIRVACYCWYHMLHFKRIQSLGKCVWHWINNKGDKS